MEKKRLVVGISGASDAPVAIELLHRSQRRYHGQDYEIAARMADYFTNFFKNGDPNREGLPIWEPYSSGCYNAMTFADGGGMKTVPINDVVRYKMGTSLCRREMCKKQV